MKITLKSVLVAAATFCLTFAAQAQKIGYLNSTAIMADLPEMKSADSDLQAFVIQKQNLDSIKVTGWQNKVRAFQDQVEKGLLSPKQQSEEEAKLKEEQAELSKSAQDVSQEIQKKRADLYKPLVEKFNAAVKKVSKDNGYTYVIEATTGVLLYASEAGNVENLVRKELGLPEIKLENK